MRIKAYKFEGNTIIQQDEIPSKDWKEKLDWISIYVHDRRELSDILDELELLKGEHEFIIHPDTHPIPKIDVDLIVQNIVASSNDNFYTADYFTIILTTELVLTIFPENSGFALQHNHASVIREGFTDLRFYFLSALVGDIMAQNIKNINIARQRLRKMESLLMTEPEELSSQEVMNTRSDMARLSDIIEDQYIAFGVLSSFFVNKKREDDIAKFNALIKRFDELNRMVLRLEETAESLRVQFMLIQQEESTRKINLLTIMQVIFVPLTFIAGVYGMNFANMPELNMKYAYFVVWGVFILLAAVLLYFFKRNGWFD